MSMIREQAAFFIQGASEVLYIYFAGVFTATLSMLVVKTMKFIKGV
jgi:hypothetical protein